MSMPSPILILGDRYLSQNNINIARKKYKNYKWVSFSASKDSVDEIRGASGQNEFIPVKKIILIDDLPNKKMIREFLLDLVQSSSSTLKFIIWDSTGTIKIDPKKRTFNKTWGDWISELQKNENCKIINNGFDFTEKDKQSCISFIQSRFEKHKITISEENASLLAKIVGRQRGMLASEIQKLVLISPSKITKDFILENAFPSAKDAVIYKFSNALNSGSYSYSLDIMNEFMDMGIHPNVLTEIMAKKARWQLVAVSLWVKGFSWDNVVDTMSNMGKYPSEIWHQHSLTASQRKSQTKNIKSLEDRMEYMVNKYHLKEHQINPSKKAIKAITIPWRFMAQTEVDFLRNKIINNNQSKYSVPEIKSRMMDRGLNLYLFVLERMKRVRYSENVQQDLQESVAALTSCRL